jgi:hypothetical protein
LPASSSFSNFRVSNNHVGQEKNGADFATVFPAQGPYAFAPTPRATRFAAAAPARPPPAISTTPVDAPVQFGYDSRTSGPPHTRPAPVAQLDRALPSEGRGHRFESCRVRQIDFSSMADVLFGFPRRRPALLCNDGLLSNGRLQGWSAARRVDQASARWVAARSAIITTGACVLPDTMLGITDAPAIVSPPIPCTASFGSTTAMPSLADPIFAVPTGCKIVVATRPPLLPDPHRSRSPRLASPRTA